MLRRRPPGRACACPRKGILGKRSLPTAMAAVVPRKPPIPPSREGGFVLPLALGVSMLLLLSSLSLQTVALQGHFDQLSEAGRGRDEDALVGAAQRLVGELNLRHACLLSLPLSRWAHEGQSCASLPQQEALVGEAGSFGGRLLAWSPGAMEAEALIEAEPAVHGGIARRGVFQVVLHTDPLRAQSPRLLGLRGVAP